MNNISEYLNIDIPENWKQDQGSWRLSESLSNSFKSSYVSKWIQDNKKYNMERSNTDLGNNQLNYLKLNQKQIENQIKQLEIHLTTLNELSDSEQIQDKIVTIEDEIDDLQKEKERITKDIENATQISNIFQNKFDIPTFGKTDQVIDWASVCGTINQKVDGHDPNEFSNTWKIVKSLAEANKWSEKNVCEVLSFLLSGECYEFFEHKKDKPFEERITRLLTAFLPVDNLMTRRHQLENVKRRRGQSLPAFMEMLDHYIDRSSIGYPQNIRRGRKDNILEVTLLKVCSESAKKKIESKISDAYEAGYFLTINEKIAIASRQETVANDAPEEDISISLNDQEPSTRRSAYVYNAEIEEPAYADLNSISSTRRPTSRSLNRTDRQNNESIREGRRRELSDRRSSSRDEVQSRYRKVSFTDPMEITIKNPEEHERQKGRLDTSDVNYRRNTKESFPTQSTDPQPPRNKQAHEHTMENYKLIRQQQHMIEELQKQLEELSIQRFKEKQTYYNYHEQQRPKLNKTYTLQNLFPDPFQIQINPTRQQEYFRYSNREGNQRDYQNYNSQNRSFTGSRMNPRNYSNYRDWNDTQTRYRTNNNQYQKRFQPAPTGQSLNYHQRNAIDRTEQWKKTTTCPYCRSNERHDWSKCGNKTTIDNAHNRQQEQNAIHIPNTHTKN